MQHVRFAKAIRVLKIAGHTGLILFFLLVPLVLFYQTKIKVPGYSSPFISPAYWFFSLVFIAFFYGYTYYLIPLIFDKKQYVKALTIFLLVCVFFYFSKPAELFFGYVLLPLSGKRAGPFDIFSLDIFAFLIFIMLCALGLAIQIIKHWRASEKRAMQAEADKANAELSFLKAELAFLKAQINPHFLFNSLNNIYSLSVDQHPDTSESIMKLSNIMRFVTDEATQDFVPLESEVTCISDYIDLQRLRLDTNIEVDFTVSGNLENKQIAPLMLITFIENVFKFGITTDEPAIIKIHLFADEHKINFFCQNKIYPVPRLSERAGIGLINTKKRLEHLYPGKHVLNITNEAGFYTVDLTLVA